VKLNSFPARTFHGQVLLVSQKAESVHEAPVFYARVAISNADGSLRSGMEGRGKVKTGTYPAGYVLLRRPYIWIMSKLWDWMGW
jgi:hypothetical protein